MLPPFVQELFLLCRSDVLPRSRSKLSLDEQEKSFVEKNTTAEGPFIV
jgi:hypothetical protein